MKVVNREDFLKYPEGTIYCMGKEWYFDQLCIKGETWKPEGYIGDWIFLNPSWSAGKDSGECFAILEASLATGGSFESANSWGRDGGFDDKDLFLIYEKEDLLKLKGFIDEALQNNRT